MADAIHLLAEAARGAVAEIAQPYDDYHAHLVDEFTNVLRISHQEPTERLAQREIEEAITNFATRVSAQLEEIS